MTAFCSPWMKWLLIIGGAGGGLAVTRKKRTRTRVFGVIGGGLGGLLASWLLRRFACVGQQETPTLPESTEAWLTEGGEDALDVTPGRDYYQPRPGYQQPKPEYSEPRPSLQFAPGTPGAPGLQQSAVMPQTHTVMAPQPQALAPAPPSARTPANGQALMPGATTRASGLFGGAYGS